MRAGFLGEIDLTLPDRHPHKSKATAKLVIETKMESFYRYSSITNSSRFAFTPLTSMRLRAFELWARGNAEHRPNSHEEQLESREWMLLTV
jgi:hypothetical protein